MTRWLLWLYKHTLSPLLHALAGGSACRFQPTCSEYAEAHGSMRGSLLAMGRVLRCHPLSPGGFDPVPGTGFDGVRASAAKHGPTP